MKKYLFSFLVLLLVLPFILVSCSGDDDEDIVLIGYQPIAVGHTMPYQDIIWTGSGQYGQYKASLHVHSLNSDGSHTQADMIETYYALGFEILAFTEHNYGRNASQTAGTDMLTFPYTKDWVSHNRVEPPHAQREVPLTQARYDEIIAGIGRPASSGKEGKPMLRVPNTSEIAVYPDEANFFFFAHDWERSVPGGVVGGAHIRNPIGLNALFNEVEDHIDEDTQLRAIGFINHPGRTTGGAGRYDARGEAASKERGWVNMYTAIFNRYTSCLGFEIVNRGTDADSASDRILWDSVLTQVIPHGKRNVWGFANDDAHSANGAGHAWNVFIMEENTVEAFHEAMLKGNFYAVTRRAHRELGQNIYGGVPGTQTNVPNAHLGAYPQLTGVRITGSGNNIILRLTVENAPTTNWISDGKVIVDTHGNPVNTNNLRLADYPSQIGSYVRANIIGPGGIAFTQPFPVAEIRGN